MSELLDTVKSIAMTDPAMPRLVKRITANFDDFKEVGGSQWSRYAGVCRASRLAGKFPAGRTR